MRRYAPILHANTPNHPSQPGAILQPYPHPSSESSPGVSPCELEPTPTVATTAASEMSLLEVDPEKVVGALDKVCTLLKRLLDPHGTRSKLRLGDAWLDEGMTKLMICEYLRSDVDQRNVLTSTKVKYVQSLWLPGRLLNVWCDGKVGRAEECHCLYEPL